MLAVAVAVPVLSIGACTTNALVAKGGACFQSIDCQEKLVCIVAVGADAGTCTDDLTTIVDVPDVNIPEAQAFDVVVTDQVAPADNNVPETSPPQDSGTQETSTNDASGE